MTDVSLSSGDSREDQAIPALDVRDLSVVIRPRRGEPLEILDRVSFSVMPGEAVGIVGESGSGKTMTSLAVMGLLPASAEVTRGEILVGGTDVLTLSPARRRRLLGGTISMVLQDPVTSLDPSFTIGSQLSEAFRLHRGMRGRAIRDASVEILERVRIPSASERLDQYPHELSGGMRQRVCSAIALSGKPDVLIADEPTTALDVTTQAQYLAMLRDLQMTTGFSLVLITHDLGIIRQMCQKVVVMYAGQVVEIGPLRDVVAHPQHPYTRALFDSLPTLDPDAELHPIGGRAPEPGSFPAHCRFEPRCMFARDVCRSEAPTLGYRPATEGLARCFGTEDDGWIDT